MSRLLGGGFGRIFTRWRFRLRLYRRLLIFSATICKCLRRLILRDEILTLRRSLITGSGTPGTTGPIGGLGTGLGLGGPGGNTNSSSFDGLPGGEGAAGGNGGNGNTGNGGGGGTGLGTGDGSGGTGTILGGGGGFGCGRPGINGPGGILLPCITMKRIIQSNNLAI